MLKMRAWLIIRVVLGLLIGPLVPAILVAIPDAFAPSPWGPELALLIAARAGYPPLLLAALVFTFGLKRLPRSIWECLWVGTLLGVIGYFYGVLDFSSVMGFEDSLGTVAVTMPFIPVSMICGAIAGSAFWLFIRRWRAFEAGQ